MSPREILFPREHGAWALLAGAFLLAWAHPWARETGSLLLALLFLLTFAAQAPLREVAAGRGGRAWIWLLAYLVPSVAIVVFLVTRYGVILLLPAGFFAAIFTGVDLIARRRKLHRSIGHRIVGAAGISLLLPAMLCLFHPDMLAYSILLWGLVLLYFVSRMPLVRAHGAVRRDPSTAKDWRRRLVLTQVALLALVITVIALRLVGPWILVAFIPGIATALMPVRGLSNPALGKREALILVWFLAWLVVSFHLGAFDGLLG